MRNSELVGDDVGKMNAKKFDEDEIGQYAQHDKALEPGMPDVCSYPEIHEQ